ncbi:hypothetical protein J1G44_17405 [Cellulomonas sp. zg-ZUI199]|uniref:HTH luxR-type domain-containing protein n=1 Tax=Cellulomonas wangleii TaxID=2816956 RepID=A0ABX8D5M5_9CELL|nr:hypothetical protein [Cellulomonas wangleii]MBO0926254.1 hypothetical protein [Cellulomonas wangleii]QVI62760.1 hypothetical protein KG103_02120 [Cellulomonas wangleii]
MEDDQITIQAPCVAGQPARQLTVRSGQSASVGVCRCSRCDLHLRIEDDGTPAFTAEITAGRGYWSVSNLSDQQPIRIVNMDDLYQYFVVEPGRRRVPVPFELSQIGPTNAPSGSMVTIFGPEPRRVLAHQPVCREAPARVLLDPGSTYHRVLRELCRPRLAGSLSAPLPTSSQIATALSSGRRQLTARAVDAHIRYVSAKLDLPRGAGRDALVAIAIRLGAVQ